MVAWLKMHGPEPGDGVAHKKGGVRQWTPPFAEDRRGLLDL